MASEGDRPAVNETSSETSSSAPAAPSTVAGKAPSASEPPGGSVPTEDDDRKAAHAARLAKFAELKKKAAEARKLNMKAAQEEAKRMASDPTLLSKLERKRVNATQKLLKDETPDFERKRAWDWTAEESEKWDEHLEKKQRNRDAVSFANYSDEAAKTYDRQIGALPQPTEEDIIKRRQEEIQRAVARGELDLVDNDDGTVRVVDRKGTFYARPEQYQFDHKPSEEAIDRLVAAMDKDEQRRLKNRGQRARKEENGDVTYINEKVSIAQKHPESVDIDEAPKNKQFNDKLARFYNKYTSDIRESFERGTNM